MVPTNNEQPTKTPSTGSAETGDRRKIGAIPSEMNKDEIGGISGSV